MAYLGKTPSQAVRSRYYFTASGGETSLSGTDDNSNTLTFTDGNYVDVSLNGVALVAGTDYNTTTANTIGGLTALVASDVVEVIVYDTFSVFSGNVSSDFSVGGNLTVTGTSSFAGDISLGDNVKAKFGASDDLQIFHDGSNSYVQDAGDGALILNTTNGGGVYVYSAGETMATFNSNGAVNLYYDNAAKLATTSTGIDVTGRITTDAITEDTSGNVGIGTSSVPSAARAMVSGGRFYVNSQDQYSVLLQNGGTSGGFIGTTGVDTINFFSSSGTERMRIDSSGNVGIGTSSPLATLDVSNSTLSTIRSTSGSYNLTAYQYATGFAYLLTNGQFEIGTSGANLLTLKTNNTERLRIESGGDIEIKTVSKYLRFNSPSSTFDFSGQPSGTDYLRLTTSSSGNFFFYANGALYNTTGTYGTISDLRLKENVVDATSKLDELMQLRVVNYNFKTSPDTKMLGFIAQEVEQVFPSLVEAGEEVSGEEPYKSVKTSVLVPMLVKAIQEQQLTIEALETEMTSVKARLDALEAN